MSGPTYYDLLVAGYRPEQILVCPLRPCLCKTTGVPQKDCGMARKAGETAELGARS